VRPEDPEVPADPELAYDIPEVPDDPELA